VVKAFAVGVRHRLSELTDENQALTEGETREPPAEKTIKAGSVWVMLEHKGRAELRFAVIEGTLDADVLYPLQNTEFPLRGAR
jgi:hypothetical protein